MISCPTKGCKAQCSPSHPHPMLVYHCPMVCLLHDRVSDNMDFARETILFELVDNNIESVADFLACSELDLKELACGAIGPKNALKKLQHKLKAKVDVSINGSLITGYIR